MWTGAGDGLEVNTPEAGWQVNYSDNKTRLFIYWTSDLNGRTGCYNLDCAVKHANSVTRGRIRNSQPNGHHASTQMGSGHFPSEGFGKASMINNLGYVNESGVLSDPEILVPFVTKPSYYDVQLGKPEQNGYVAYFFFRGPGFSKTCP
ncbi:hypothetical protein GH714_038096 [Hevea brasiliensis]|uniref:Neprosin PEP catalytic domain-containing protein n=1 Tax=Hevea brasiliensis TaxID=3981 RepID=A0A6A6M767_HEVBR|nr:hypothetical protein GH714_038096 [Hevea brasiliensis]